METQVDFDAIECQSVPREPVQVTCAICAAPLPWSPRAAGPLCGAPLCRAAYDRIPKAWRCGTCGRPLKPADLGLGHCGDRPSCRFAFLHAKVREREQRRQAQIVARLDEARRLRDGGAAGIADPSLYPLALIPAYTAAVTDLPAERRDMMRAHLASLLPLATDEAAAAALAAGGGTPQPPPAPRADAVFGQACGVCKGKCCRTGKDDAYITWMTIYRYRRAHPEQSPDEVIESYLSHIGPRTYENSCVYHGPNGCTLPHGMRSSTCDDFFCGELRVLYDAARDGGPLRTFVASVPDETSQGAAPIHGDRIIAAAFLDETGVHPVAVELSGRAGDMPTAQTSSGTRGIDD